MSATALHIAAPQSTLLTPAPTHSFTHHHTSSLAVHLCCLSPHSLYRVNLSFALAATAACVLSLIAFSLPRVGPHRCSFSRCRHSLLPQLPLHDEHFEPQPVQSCESTTACRCARLLPCARHTSHCLESGTTQPLSSTVGLRSFALAMGGVCSLEDAHDDEAQHGGKSAPHPSVHPSHHHNQSASSAQSASHAPHKQQYRDDELPRDVVMQRLWTSVVVGELVKNHTVSMYDENLSVLTVVHAMMKSGANYAIIRKTPAAAVSSAPAAPQPSITASGGQSRSTAGTATNPLGGAQRTFRAARKQRDEYIGLFDWRDLNALLVAVCKTNRLHAQQPNTPAGAAATATPQMKLRQNNSMASLSEEDIDEEDDSSRQQRGSIDSAQSAGDAQPRQLQVTVAAVVGATTSSNRSSPAAPNKRAIQLTATDSPHAQPASPNRASSSTPATSIPAPLSIASPSASATSSSLPSTSASSSSAFSASSSTDSPLAPYLHFLDMKRAPVQLISNLSTRNPMQIVNTACPLLGGAKLLVGLIGHNQATAEGANGTQRIASRLWDKKGARGAASDSGASDTKQELYRLTILNKDGVFVGCMTQLALCLFVKEKLDSIGALADESLHELGLGRTKRVLTISWKSPVLTALLLMHDKRLSALAIVNDGNGKLVGTISCSDVKYLFLAPELLLTLQRPVSVFVSALRQSSSHWHVNLTANSPPTAMSSSVTVTPKHTLRSTVDVLLANKVRRAWVVNESEQPIGMVSISDIVKFALPNTAQLPSQTPAHGRH